ncbi:MAG: hypothetical protein JNJ54_14670 [Myxococcaceae bacterium]|nr:hypothetical protein [Myxococcaceae bacterium]
MKRFTLVVVALAAVTASAQYTNSYGYSFNNPISASVNSMFWDRMNSRLVYRVMLKKRGYTDAQLGQMTTAQMLEVLGGSKQAVEASKALPAPTASRFKPAKKRLLVPSLAAAMTKDPEQQAALKTLFEAGLTAYETEAAKEGLANDLAGAMTFFIGIGWMVSHDGQEPDEDGVTLLARQLQQALETPELKKVPDADKQQFYELMVSLGTWLLATWQQAEETKDAQLRATAKEAARAIITGYLKVEPSQVRIGPAGLEFVK